MANKCAYPPCPVMIESGGDNPPVFCEKHPAVKCLIPRCILTTIPQSSFCQEHDWFVQDFDVIHGIRHQQAAQQQAMAAQNEAIRQQMLGKGNGHQGGLVIRGR